MSGTSGFGLPSGIGTTRGRRGTPTLASAQIKMKRSARTLKQSFSTE